MIAIGIVGFAGAGHEQGVFRGSIAFIEVVLGNWRITSVKMIFK